MAMPDVPPPPNFGEQYSQDGQGAFQDPGGEQAAQATLVLGSSGPDGPETDAENSTSTQPMPQLQIEPNVDPKGLEQINKHVQSLRDNADGCKVAREAWSGEGKQGFEDLKPTEAKFAQAIYDALQDDPPKPISARHCIGQRMVAEMTEKQKEAYHDKTQAEQEKMRRGYAKAKLEKFSQGKKEVRSWKK